MTPDRPKQVAAPRSVPVLDDSYEITVADIKQAQQRRNIRIEEGDAGWRTTSSSATQS